MFAREQGLIDKKASRIDQDVGAQSRMDGCTGKDRNHAGAGCRWKQGKAGQGSQGFMCDGVVAVGAVGAVVAVVLGRRVRNAKAVRFRACAGLFECTKSDEDCLWGGT